MWCIWKVRNARSFEGIKSPLLQLKLFFPLDLFMIGLGALGILIILLFWNSYTFLIFGLSLLNSFGILPMYLGYLSKTYAKH